MSSLFRRLSNRKRKEDPPAPSSSSEKSSNLSPASAHGRATSSFATDGLPPPYSASTATAPDPIPEGEQPIPEDPYIHLKEFDTVFLIDDSESMRGSASAGKNYWAPSRWEQVSRTLAEIAPICTKYDKNGIDIHFLNQPDRKIFMGITKSDDVIKIFREVIPRGRTPTGSRLRNILDPYFLQCFEASQRNKKAPKPLNLIVITDGEPSNPVEVELVLGRIGKKLDDIEANLGQLGVQFFQVGDNEEASEWLRALDDELEGFDEVLKEKCKCRDFVDTQRYIPGMAGGLEKDVILKTVLGAVNKRLDRKRINEAT